MIQSFSSKTTEKFWLRENLSALDPRVAKSAMRRLQVLDAATSIQDLLSSPGNRLEKLGGTRKGQYSIRINKQWRVCFYWSEDGPHNVEIIDYH